MQAAGVNNVTTASDGTPTRVVMISVHPINFFHGPVR